jgi:hypothetical protein
LGRYFSGGGTPGNPCIGSGFLVSGGMSFGVMMLPNPSFGWNRTSTRRLLAFATSFPVFTACGAPSPLLSVLIIDSEIPKSTNASFTACARASPSVRLFASVPTVSVKPVTDIVDNVYLRSNTVMLCAVFESSF